MPTLTDAQLNTILTEYPKLQVSVADLFGGAAKERSQTLSQVLDAYNKSQPQKDLKVARPSSAEQQLLATQELVNSLRGTNAGTDIRKYFHPKALVALSQYLESGGGGEVSSESPGTIRLPAYQKLGSTLVHESAHVDSNLAPTQGYMFGTKASPITELLSMVVGQAKAAKLPIAGNSDANSDELRANLRAILGSAPAGSSVQDVLGGLIAKAYATGKEPQKYVGNIVGSSGNYRSSIPQAQAARQLEQDLFPRERWIEPRQPTALERVKDFLGLK